MIFLNEYTNIKISLLITFRFKKKTLPRWIKSYKN